MTKLSTLKVKDLMVINVVYATVPGSRQEVLRLMKEKGVSGMPVVKKGTRKLIGMITRTDLVNKPTEEQVALIMTRNPLKVSPDDPVTRAAELMVKYNIRRLPVVVDDELVGIITVSDIIHKALANSDLMDPIINYMDRQVLAVWEGTPLPVVLSIMRLAGVRALLVLDSSSNLSGIVTDTDLMKISEITFRERVSSSKPASEGQEWDWDVSTMIYIGRRELSLPNRPVSEVMTKKVVTALEFMPINECARRMREHDIDQLPVLDPEGKLVGIVYDHALLRSLTK
ncbi:MAG: CBS domain-containing protein [Candidatus Nezhaarchaeales archaeon]